MIISKTTAEEKSAQISNRSYILYCDLVKRRNKFKKKCEKMDQ